MSDSSSNAENKTCKVYFPTEACSGNGVCDTNTGMCICNKGWSAIGDLSVIDGASCSINLNALKIMNSVVIVFPILHFLVCVRYFFLRWKTWKQSKVAWNDPVMIFPTYLIISATSWVIYCTIKIVDSEYFSIGNEIFATVIFFFFAYGTFGGVLVFVEVLLKFLVAQTKIMSSGARERTQKNCMWTKKGVRGLHIFCVITFILPLFILKYPDAVEPISGILFINTGIFAIVLTYYLIFALSSIIKEINTHLKDRDTNSTQADQIIRTLEDLRSKLSKAKATIYSQVPPPTLAYLMLGFWPFLARNCSYLWPMIAIAANNVAIPMILSVTLNPASKTTNIKSEKLSTNGAILPRTNVGASPDLDKSMPDVSSQASLDDGKNMIKVTPAEYNE